MSDDLVTRERDRGLHEVLERVHVDHNPRRAQSSENELYIAQP